VFWKKKLPLPPLAEGERDIWVELYVDLLAPIPDPDDPGGEPIEGYFQSIGLRLREQDPKRVLEHVVSDGNIDWEYTEWKDVVPSEVYKEARDAIQAPDRLGVWFRSEKDFD
jgi:hypothetical protein